MILDQRAAKRFAARVVAAMIRQGCSGEVMRRRRITEGTYHWTLGSRAHAKEQTPSECATYLIGQYRPDYLFLPNK